MKPGVQLTLGLLKPDLAGNPRIVEMIQKQILQNDFYILKRREVRWQEKQSKIFYKQHESRFFHQRLVEFMASGPIIALLLAKENAIADWRKLLGPTKVYKTQYTDPDTIRGKFGLTDTRNSVHGSDSPESVLQEASLFFPDVCIKEVEKKTIVDNLVFNAHCGIHTTQIIAESKTSFFANEKPEQLQHNLGDGAFWSKHYEESKSPMEWFVGFKELDDLFKTLLLDNPSYHTLLDIGCGLSTLALNLSHSYQRLDVYCLDTSVECLKTLCQQQSFYSNCVFIVGDACQQLPFDNSGMDVVIDKGTSDAVCRHSMDGKKNFQSMLQEAWRVLKANGTLVQITTEQPDVRLDQLRLCQLPGNSISFQTLSADSNGLPVFCYLIKKVT